MESDSTIPATDDFGSRFLEMDEYDDGTYQVLSEESLESSRSHAIPGKRGRSKLTQSRRSFTKRQFLTPKRTRPIRQSRRPPARVTDTYDGSSETESDSFAMPISVSSARSRTRMGYQNSQKSLWTLEDVMAPPEKATDHCGTSGETAVLTTEQMEIRQRRIERRRESAKNKAEKEMQDTVERLLRVNTEYAGGSGACGGNRGRSRRAPVLAESACDSDESEIEKKKKNAMQPSLPLDPPSGSIRFISSLRLRPHCLIALPVADEIESEVLQMFRARHAPPPPITRLCEQCRVAPRRYSCPRTGRSLCSLECFKAC